MTTALITGAGRGLGFEFARQLLERGDTVFAAVRNPAKYPALAALGEAHPGRLHTLTLDVSSPDSIAAARAAFGAPSLDLLINNAGINYKAVPKDQANLSFGSLEPEGILHMSRVNAVGPLLLTQAFADLLEASAQARVINIGSWFGSLAGRDRGGNYAYCASKAMLGMFTRILSHDLGPKGVICVIVNPGWVATDMGGTKAALTPQQSVSGILALNDSLTMEHNGNFYDHDGSTHVW